MALHYPCTRSITTLHGLKWLFGNWQIGWAQLESVFYLNKQFLELTQIINLPVAQMPYVIEYIT
jgi:hypothetical protein